MSNTISREAEEIVRLLDDDTEVWKSKYLMMLGTIALTHAKTGVTIHLSSSCKPYVGGVYDEAATDAIAAALGRRNEREVARNRIESQRALTRKLGLAP